MTRPRATSRIAILAAVLVVAPLGSAVAQGSDCQALRAKIAALDAPGTTRSNRYAAAARKQRAELDRTIAYARSLGCDQPEIPFFGKPLPARCPGLNGKIAQMQANLGQLEAAASTSTDRTRHDLMARYDAYCRTPTRIDPANAVPNFFEALFGAFNPSQPGQQPPAAPWAPPMDESPYVEPDTSPRGGSEALCVRSCDGGFFPLHVSARRADPAYLGALCRALCPNAAVGVFTRAPYGDIERAVSLEDGSTYAELPNALRFRKSHESSCSCKPAQQSWVEALAPAEQILGEGRRGDIVVTPETSAQLSRAQAMPRAKSSSRRPGETGAAEGGATADAAGATTAPLPGHEKEVVGPDGVKRRVRIISPTL